MTAHKHTIVNTPQRSSRWPLRSLCAVALLVVLVAAANLHFPMVHAAPVAPTLPISQVPLTTVVANHPQILFAVGNSESMDGTLAGAIMTGSGSFAANLSALASSSSPTSYAVPQGFTPPLQAADETGNTPYTVKQGTTLYDNGASRLNVAKGAISAILNKYMPNADFALLGYATSGTALYNTMVYYMSPNGGFQFTNTQTDGTRYVNNPCYGYKSLPTTSIVYSNCVAINATFPAYGINDNQYMSISASSDDPNINDVLYWNNSMATTLVYGGPSPANPYTYYTLAQYNANQIQSAYSTSTPSGGATTTTPTNAGYVPYSTQVLYAQRGFGYGGGQSSTTGNTVVGMSSAIDAVNTTPTSATIAAAIAKFSAALAPETNNVGTSEMKASAGQSALAGLLAGAKTAMATYKPPVTDCPTHQYVVLITDGLPTLDLAGKSWPPLGTEAAAGYGVTATFNDDGSYAGNDQALIDTLKNINALQAAGVETYVIGLGAGVDPAKNPAAAETLHAMALAGGTGSDYLPATSPQALVDSLGQVLAQVLAKNISTSSAAANSTSLNNNSQVFQATFSTSGWIGDVSEYSIDPTTAAISTTATWSAQAQLDALGWSNRHIATWDPFATNGSTVVNPAAVGFAWDNLSPSLQTLLANSPSDSTDTGANRVDYLRGSNLLQQDHSGGIYRNRLHLLGDVVDSSPEYVGAPSASYDDVSYDSFVATQKTRKPMLYFGANDGMLHGIDAATGAETMAFIPYGVFANLPLLTAPLYNQNHHFFVDGSPSTRDVLLDDGNWHTLLVGGENAGGRTIFAIDVTNPGAFTSDANVAKAVKWEFIDSDMGLSYSAPVIVRSRASAVTVTDAASNADVNGFAVLFGNGYNSASGHAIFYAVNASTGAQISKIDLCEVVTTACDSSEPNGLSSITPANSSGVIDVYEDMAYAGDLQGNLWAIDMSNTDASQWTAALLFQARDSAGAAQPITSAPALTLNPNFPNALGLMAFFGTGQLLTQSDLTNTQSQTFYGVWDNRPMLDSYAAPKPAPPYGRANLQEQTISLDTATVGGQTVPVVQSTNNRVNLTFAALAPVAAGDPEQQPQQGWYFDLGALDSSQQSARSVTNARVEDGGIVFTTNALTSSLCAAGGKAFMMNVRFDTGGPFSEAAIGLNGGIHIGSSSVNGKNPTGVLVDSGFSASPTAVKSSAGTNVQVISTADGLQVVPTIGNKSARIGWWQIQ